MNKPFKYIATPFVVMLDEQANPWAYYLDSDGLYAAPCDLKTLAPDWESDENCEQVPDQVPRYHQLVALLKLADALKVGG